MNIFSSGQSWHNYEDLETNVLECFTYVALDVDHLEVWSNRLGELLLRIGSAIDSFFYTARTSSLFENEQGIQELPSDTLKTSVILLWLLLMEDRQVTAGESVSRKWRN